jgi:hypothetical protein
MAHGLATEKSTDLGSQLLAVPVQILHGVDRDAVLRCLAFEEGDVEEW